jgi:hypothetical protein
MPHWRTESAQVSAALVKHPKAKRFQEAVLADPVFGSTFGADEPNTGRSATIYRSTFRSNGIQLSMLSEVVLVNAWRRATDRGQQPTIEEFCNLAREQFRFMRVALTGQVQPITVRLAFTGILLPPGTEWRTSAGIRIRETTDQDRQLAPEALKRQHTGTDATGTTTIVNYDGDVVVELERPFKAQALPRPADDPFSIFDGLASGDALERLTTRLRLSLMLAVRREHRVQLAPTWQYFEDPFDFGRLISWADSTQVVGLMPTQLTSEEVAAWQEWFQLLENPDADRVHLALSRVIQASAERRDPSDVLVDSVIAWENLFGTKDGEPTLRVTASLAILLEQDPTARLALRSKLAKIYTLRSKVVHGSGMPTKHEIALCQEALDVVIRALQVLLRDRTDVLAQPDGGLRSLHLIMGAVGPIR